MSDQMRILVVEDDEQLNQGIVNSLRKDGYFVQGVRSGAEAIRVAWLEEYDVVIGDLKTPGADGFELLQWLRIYRPKTRMIMVAGTTNSAEARRQALEAGVVSYLEKPLDLHKLKEELRRLLQQTGFSANLDSFDLLDVIQIITMSRKNIALLITIGLEERGILRFQEGELIWAEYGMLRGEEAFFALAAHKNGTVIHQPWNEQITANVTQPLSRLIFQALQYRAKYAMQKRLTGEQEAVKLPTAEIDDDSPFVVLVEESVGMNSGANGGNGNNGNNAKEWWQPSEKIAALNINGNAMNVANPLAKSASNEQTPANGSTIVSESGRKISNGQQSDLPSWLTEQPTRSDLPALPALRPSSLSGTTKTPATFPPISSTPILPITPTPIPMSRPTPRPIQRPAPAEWQPVQPVQPTQSGPLGQVGQPPAQAKTTVPGQRKQQTAPQKSMQKSGEMGNRRTGSPEWNAPEQTPSGSLPGIARSRKTSDALSVSEWQSSEPEDADGMDTTGKMGVHRAAKRNYAALVATLQTLGYSVQGFVATAIVSMDGQPIAQVAVDDLDIAHMCGNFSRILQGALQSLELGKWGSYEDVIITSAERLILLRMVSEEKAAFQVLITTRAADASECLEVMANVEGAIEAAL